MRLDRDWNGAVISTGIISLVRTAILDKSSLLKVDRS